MEIVVDTDNPREKRMILDKVRDLAGGFYRFTIVKFRPRRTDRQNRFYWPAFVQPFADYLRVGKPQFTDEMAHEVLKRMFLEESVCDTNTGQVFTYVRSTTDLSTVEFNGYLDKIADLFVNELNLPAPSPELYRERAEVMV